MEIQWRQENRNSLVISLIINQISKEYYLGEDIINFLAEFKQVHLHIIIENSEEQCVLMNFTGLMAAVKEPKGLGLGKVIETVPPEHHSNKVAIARGDTFAAKWLAPNGWRQEKHYFALKPFLPDAKSEKKTCPACAKRISINAYFCGYCGTPFTEIPDKKKCSNNECNKSIKISAKFCPYCGKKQ